MSTAGDGTNSRKIHLSHVFAGRNVGVTQVGDHACLVTFMHYDFGYFDDEGCRLEPIEKCRQARAAPRGLFPGDT